MARTGQPATRLVEVVQRACVVVDVLAEAEHVESPWSVQDVAQLGRASSAHATAAGKVLLAFGWVTLPPAPLTSYTLKTISRRSALTANLALTRERGYAYEFGECEDDLHAIAAPVWEARTSSPRSSACKDRPCASIGQQWRLRWRRF